MNEIAERFRIVPDPSGKGRWRYEPQTTVGLQSRGDFPTANAARRAFEQDLRKARAALAALAGEPSWRR